MLVYAGIEAFFITVLNSLYRFVSSSEIWATKNPADLSRRAGLGKRSSTFALPAGLHVEVLRQDIAGTMFDGTFEAEHTCPDEPKGLPAVFPGWCRWFHDS